MDRRKPVSWRGWAACVLAALSIPSGVVAQDRTPSAYDGFASAIGQVVDQNTGAPLVGAFVHFEGVSGGVYTDDRGVFYVRDRRGSDRVVIEMLGYGKAYVPASLVEGAPPIRIPLHADPVVLEGIEVVVDRFQRRRNASAASVRVFDQRQLRRYANQDVVQFVESRTFLREVPCGLSVTALASTSCMRSRGRVVRATICVDEVPALGGLEMLRSVSAADLYQIEVFVLPVSRNVQIRMYTPAFMEGAARVRLSPTPLEFGC